MRFFLILCIFFLSQINLSYPGMIDDLKAKLGIKKQPHRMMELIQNIVDERHYQRLVDEAQYNSLKDPISTEILPGREGIGVMYFVYGLEQDKSQTKMFQTQAEFSAQSFRRKNPNIKLGIFTTDPDSLSFPFDFIGRIDYEDVINKRQWLTRIMYMKRTPFEVTLAVDSQALCCSNHVYDMLESFRNRTVDYDIAFNAKYGLNLKHLHAFEPHNWIILYRINIRVDKLFNTWRTIHEPQEKRKPARDDQSSLFKAVRYERRNGLRLGRLSNTFAVACVESSKGTDKMRRTTHLLGPDRCHIFHLTVKSRSDEDHVCGLCSRDHDMPRVLVQLAYAQYHISFSQEDLNRVTQYRAMQIEWNDYHTEIAYDWDGLVRRKKGVNLRGKDHSFPGMQPKLADEPPGLIMPNYSVNATQISSYLLGASLHPTIGGGEHPTLARSPTTKPFDLGPQFPGGAYLDPNYNHAWMMMNKYRKQINDREEALVLIQQQFEKLIKETQDELKILKALPNSRSKRNRDQEALLKARESLRTTDQSKSLDEARILLKESRQNLNYWEKMARANSNQQGRNEEEFMKKNAQSY